MTVYTFRTAGFDILHLVFLRFIVTKKQNLIQKILCLPLISLSGRPAAVAYKWDLIQKNDLILDLWNKEAIFKLKG